MVMVKGWRDGTAYYLATDRRECLEAFACFMGEYEYVDGFDI